MKEPTETDVAAFCATYADTIQVLDIVNEKLTYVPLADLSEWLRRKHIHYYVTRRVFPERVARGAA